MDVTKVGLIGAGGMGNAHARHYARIDEADVRFFDRSPDRAREFSERYQLEAMPSQDSLMDWADVVDICLPTDLHLETTLAALERNVGVLVEKPMVRTITECEQLLEAEEKHSGWVMPLQVVRYFPEYRRAAQMVKGGELGNIMTIRSRRGGKMPLGSDGWFREAQRSGGVLLDLSCHDFDWMRWSLGEVKRVHAQSVGFNQPEITGGDYALVVLEFESGALGHHEGTWFDPGGFRTTFEIRGTEGSLEFDSRNIKTFRMSTDSNQVAESILDPGDDPYFNQLSAAIEHWQAKERPPVSSRDGANAVSIALAAIESCHTGRPVAPMKF